MTGLPVHPLIVVSDTSPLLNLAAISRLDLLQAVYGQVLIPPTVAHELTRYGVSIPTWVVIENAHNRQAVASLLAQLDPGESEAIVLAEEIHASLILIDERKGSKVAVARGLKTIGLLGVLGEAKVRGFIPACAPILDEMVRVAGFRLGPGIRQRFLTAIGE